MDIQDHVGGTVADGSFGVCVEIVEKLFDFVLRVFCCSRLFGGDATEGNEGGDVDHAGVVKKSTNDLLEATNASEGEDG